MNLSNFASPSSPETEISVWSMIVFCLLYLPGVIANIFAIIFFVNAARKTHLTVNYLLTVLSCTDLIGCLYGCFAATSPFLRGGKELCALRVFLGTFSPLSTTCVATLLALDRYLAICWPYRYQHIFTLRSTGLLTTGMFVLSAIICTLPMTKLGSYYNTITRTERTEEIVCSVTRFQEERNRRVFGFLYGSVGCMLILLSGVWNILVVRTLVHMRSQVSTIPVGSGYPEFQTRIEIRFAKLILCLCVMMFTFWTPFMIWLLLSQIGVKISPVAVQLLATGTSVNFVVDPFVYMVVRKRFRTDFRRRFCCLHVHSPHGVTSHDLPLRQTSNNAGTRNVSLRQ